MNKSLSLATVLLGALFLAACQSKSEAPKDTEKSKNKMQTEVTIGDNADANSQLLIDFSQALTDADYTKARSLVAPDFKWYGPSPMSGDSADIDKLIANWENNHKSFPMMKILNSTPLALTSDAPNTKGDWSFVWGTYSITLPGNDKPVIFPYHMVGKISQGKLGMVAEYWDKAQFIGPMGNKVVKAN